MKTLKQNKNLKSIIACFAKDGSPSGILFKIELSFYFLLINSALLFGYRALCRRSKVNRYHKHHLTIKIMSLRAVVHWCILLMERPILLTETNICNNRSNKQSN